MLDFVTELCFVTVLMEIDIFWAVWAHVDMQRAGSVGV